MQDTWVRSLGQRDPLEKDMATHSSVLAWRIPWTEESGGHSSWGCKELDMTERLTQVFVEALRSIVSWAMSKTRNLRACLQEVDFVVRNSRGGHKDCRIFLSFFKYWFGVSLYKQKGDSSERSWSASHWISLKMALELGCRKWGLLWRGCVRRHLGGEAELGTVWGRRRSKKSHGVFEKRRVDEVTLFSLENSSTDGVTK